MSMLLGNVKTFPQGNGPDIQLKVFGDEFYARYETPEGYTVAYDDQQEKYCYAMLAAGHIVSSGISIDEPAPDGLSYHIQEDKTVRNDAFTRRKDELHPKESPPPGVFGALGRNNGLLSGQPLSIGKVRGLTIIVNFRDVRTSVTSEQVDALLNGDNFSDYNNYCSVKKYFQIMSNGKLEYTNTVVGPVQLPNNRSHYVRNAFMPEALERAVREFGVDLKQFDSQNRGIADGINFVYAGESVYRGDLWPHNSDMRRYGNLRYDGVQAQLYTIQSIGRVPADMSIGTFCHEAGHLVCRFPDLYDYGNRDGDSDPSAGLGIYCLMAYGDPHTGGRIPSPISPYFRELAGWTEEVSLNRGGVFEVKHGDYGKVYKYKTRKPNEYFMVENRSKMGIDSPSPASGLAVYHCDIYGSNEWQDGTADKHYQCALIQADGRRDLESNQRSGGDAGDLFKARSGLVLSHNTSPHSRAWGGTDSGLRISDISAPGETIRFTVGDSRDPDDPTEPTGPTGPTEPTEPTGPTGGGGSGTIIKSSSPSALIPDRDPNGVTDTVTIARSGKITALGLQVDISHTYAGDLKIEFLTPHGKATLKEQDIEDHTDDWRRAYNIGGLEGKPMAGNWSLKVIDVASGDIGILNSWKLTVRYTS
uniref:M6 family metalloprotease domain-containing protein n=1 Tax=Candidatus Kentrum sp. SD TaxID=2126332 RepID=A0A450YUB4_9GAMM|nr:MAG: M6 family metalloprotease domain-containing protein [Candidatus Kentron sp. SD]VFK45082.1 MAG: M6 family metalloprotease domain-containing protein [Candidatus Kentron sp. SD]VFK78264.1 MAG: M6 family metalloprotease domain-containing protein [Candidatus Kentron sp. SD]